MTASYKIEISSLESEIYRRRLDGGVTGQRETSYDAGQLDAYKFGQFAHQAEVDWTLEHVLFRDGITMLVAPAYTGKTFVAVDIACHLAAGVTVWHHGWEIPQPTQRVAYIVNESKQGFWERGVAAAQAHKLDYDSVAENLYVLPTAVDLFSDPNADRSPMNRLYATLDHIRPHTIIIDIFSRMIAGHNENSQEEMTHAMLQLENLRDRYNAAVLATHHAGKVSVVRGSTIIVDYPDHVIRLDPGAGNLITMQWEKHRGGLEPTLSQFVVHPDPIAGHIRPTAMHTSVTMSEERIEALQHINTHTMTTPQHLDQIWTAKSTRYNNIKEMKQEGWLEQTANGTLLLTPKAHNLLSPASPDRVPNPKSS